MKKFKIFAMVLCVILTVGILAGCDYNTKTEETEYTEGLKDQIRDMYGFPDVSNFFEYQMVVKVVFDENG